MLLGRSNHFLTSRYQARAIRRRGRLLFATTVYKVKITMAQVSRGRSNDTSFWISFFEEAGLSSKEAIQYALIFMENKITKYCLSDLTKELLQDMGITAVGHIITILKCAKKFSAAHAASEVLSRIGSQTNAKPKESYVKNILQPQCDDSDEETIQELPMSSKTDKLKGTRSSAKAPDQDVVYTVKMPRGNTERSRKLLQKAKLQRQNEFKPKSSGIFARLGDLCADSSAEAAVQKTTVFGRLGKVTDESDDDYDLLPMPKKSKIISLIPKLSSPVRLNPMMIPKKSVSFAAEPEPYADFGTMEADRLQLKRKASAINRLGATAAEAPIVERKPVGGGAVRLQNLYITRIGDRKDVKSVPSVKLVTKQQTPTTVKARLGPRSGNPDTSLFKGSSSGVFSRLG